MLEIARAYFYGYGTYKIAIPSLINIVYGSGNKVLDIFKIRKFIVNNIPYIQPLEQFMDIILPTNCHLWFLPAMFLANVLAFIIIRKYKKRKGMQIVLSFILILVAALKSPSNVIRLPYNI